tara:strand:- start:2 stop:271 length:270 start_codon:yes stop_codon:yes gene_type:complete
MTIKKKDSKEDLIEKKLGMNIIDNLSYAAQKETEQKNNIAQASSIKFKDLKNLKGNTLTEKLRNLGIKNIPKNITLEKAIQLLNKKRAN